MKIEDEVEILLQDGSIIIGKLLEKRQAGIVVKKNEYDPFSRERAIYVEMYISNRNIKTINKKDLRI